MPAFWRGDMSLRRLSVLVHNMPPDGVLRNGIERIQRKAEEADLKAREQRYLAHKRRRELALQQRAEGDG